MITQKLSISTDKHVYESLPERKRKPKRIALYESLLEPFVVLNTEWKARRDTELIRSKVTIEKASLEWYLNKLFDSVEQRIYIVRNTAAGVPFGLSDTEPDDYQEVGLSGSEPDDYIAVPLQGEDDELGFNKFGVYVPSTVMPKAAEVSGVVRNYNSSGKNFIILEI